MLGSGCSQCGDDEIENTVSIPTSVRDQNRISSSYNPEEDIQALHPELPPAREDLPPAHADLPTIENFASTFVEGDWTTYRGNQSRSGLRQSPAVETPFIEWNVQVGIQGYANTPIVTSDVVYVSSQGEVHNESDDLDGVVALNRADGSLIWRAHTDNDANGIMLSGETLLVGTDSRQLVAFNRNDGARLWTTELACRVNHAPYVHDGWAYLVRHNGFDRINVETGDLEGSQEECVRSERGSVSGEGEYMTFTFRNGPSQTFENGEFLWAGLSPEIAMRHFGAWTPALIVGDMLIQANHLWPFYAGDNEVPTRRPSAIARWRDNGQVAWATDLNTLDGDPSQDRFHGARHLRSLPWISGDRMYWTPTTRDELVAVDLSNGNEVASLAFPDCRRRAFSSIVGTPTIGYFARHDGMLYGFHLEPFEIAWQINLGSHDELGNVITHNFIEPEWGCSSTPMNGNSLFSTPAIAEDGTIFVGSGEGYLYKIRDENWR